MKRARALPKGFPPFLRKGDGISLRLSRRRVRLRAYVLCIFRVYTKVRERKRERVLGVDALVNDRLIYIVGYILSEEFKDGIIKFFYYKKEMIIYMLIFHVDLRLKIFCFF